MPKFEPEYYSRIIVDRGAVESFLPFVVKSSQITPTLQFDQTQAPSFLSLQKHPFHQATMTITMRPGRLEGKRAFVSGGAGCIGSANVRRFVEEGAIVDFCDVSGDKAEKLVREILDEGHAPECCRYVQCDVSKEAEVKRVMQELYGDDNGNNGEGRGLDILVNNAAVFVFGTVDEVTEEMWDRIFAVNVKGYAFMCKHAHPYLKTSQKNPNIVNLTSISSFVAQPGFVPYNTSKGAVLQMTRCMAMDMAPEGIRVNAVCPDVVDTEAVTNHAASLGRDREEVAQDLGSLHLLPRLASQDEVANACLFLASDDASFITGHPLMVDGGWSVR